MLPPGRLPAGADEAAAAQAALGFERVAAPAQAALAYETVLQRWPASLTAGMGLGNARLASGNLDAAAAAFEHVAQQHDSAAAWNNLASVRLRQGDLDAAKSAARQAFERAHAAEPRWIDAARDTLRELDEARSRERQ